MKLVDFSTIVEEAWYAYDPEHEIKEITDISVRVSTNYVYKIDFYNRPFLIAKLSYFGKYEHFKEDHAIVNALAHTLEPPYDRFLARSLMKRGEVFTYRHQEAGQDVWVVFYRPVRINERLPKQLDEAQVLNLGKQMGRFHKAVTHTLPSLPRSSKTLILDVQELAARCDTKAGQFEFAPYTDLIKRHCNTFLHEADRLGYQDFLEIPVFVDWNIGNFSLTKKGQLFSRWDYDWFRVCTRVMDFYFLSRVVSAAGDQTQFSYELDTLLEPRFLLFLQQYHQTFPLTEEEVRFIREAYRFFILQYVIKFGNYFFHTFYAKRLQQEAFEQYLPRLDQGFDVDKLLRACKL